MGGLTSTSATEQYEIISLAEGSTLPVKQMLAEISVPHNTFYLWYEPYQQTIMAGLQPVPKVL
jgi:hypothetical protein